MPRCGLRCAAAVADARPREEKQDENGNPEVRNAPMPPPCGASRRPCGRMCGSSRHEAPRRDGVRSASPGTPASVASA